MPSPTAYKVSRIIFPSAHTEMFEGAFEESRHEPGQPAAELRLLSWDLSQPIHRHTRKKKQLGLFSVEVGIKRSDIKKDD